MPFPFVWQIYWSTMTKLSDLIIDHYERHARAWDADRQAGNWTDRFWIERFTDRLAPSAHVLDLGCGSGKPVAEFIASHGLGVTGVDSSPTMITLCRERLPDQRWIVADMRKLTLDKKFDGILAWDSFFHLDVDDQRRMFDVFDRHASEGALLMFNAGPAHGEAIGEYRGDPLFHASLAPEEYQTLLAHHGFAITDHAVNDPRAGGRTIWLAWRR
jgi:SAM-dependent methyltransferase